MAESQEQLRKDYCAFFEEIPCGEMMRKLIEVGEKWAELRLGGNDVQMMPLCRKFMGKDFNSTFSTLTTPHHVPSGRRSALSSTPR